MSLRSLPSVDAVLSTPEAQAFLEETARSALTDAVRSILQEVRAELRETPGDSPDAPAIATRAIARVRQAFDPGLPAVVNATGVVLHTNLGRAPLAPAAIEAVARAARTACAVELDLSTGARGRRDDHVSDLLADLTGAEAGLAVNNNAAALLLAVDSLAPRREVVVSRGELIEIGGAFRLPDVLRRAGAILREVGTTNRTRVEDYERVISRRTGLLLRAHPSNYRVEGFTEQPSRGALADLARRHGIPFVEDLGSGALVDLAQYGAPHEPTPGEAIRAGVDLVTFSGDKLLGGPQAGLVVGRRDLVGLLQKNPLKRALRLDKLMLAALRATLTLYRTSTRIDLDVPTLALLARDEVALQTLADEARALLEREQRDGMSFEVVPSESEVGSGAQPTETLPSRAIRVRHPTWDVGEIAAYFRSARPAILGRISQDEFLLDLRAVLDPADLIPHRNEPSS